MSVKVILPEAFHLYTDGRTEFRLEMQDVLLSDVLNAITKRYPTLKSHIFDGLGNLRNFLTILHNDDDMLHKQGLETKIHQGDIIKFKPHFSELFTSH